MRRQILADDARLLQRQLPRAVSVRRSDVDGAQRADCGCFRFHETEKTNQTITG